MKVKKTMMAAVTQNPGIKVVDNYPIPQLVDDEVLVKVEYCGICASDIPRMFQKAKTDIIGHEATGIIAQDGHSFKSGELVAIVPLVPCHKCNFCKEGDYSLCAGYKFIGSGRNGCLAKYVNVPAKNLLRLPKKVELKDAAFIEPLTVALHAISQTSKICNLNNVRNIAVTGAGTIGLLIAQAARSTIGNNVTVIEVDDERIKRAQALGLSVIDTKLEGSIQECDSSFDMIFEATGAEPVVRSVFDLAARKSTIMLVGTMPKGTSVPAESIEKILRKEAIVTGSWMSYSYPWPGKEWRTAIELLQSSKVSVTELIQDILPLSDIKSVFERFKEGKVNGRMLIKISE